MNDFATILGAVFIAEICKELVTPFIERWVRPAVKKHVEPNMDRVEKVVDKVRIGGKE